MKTKLTLILVLITAFVGGCATADRLNALKIGMTEDQVVAELGKPDSKSAQGTIIYYTYYLSNDSGRIGDQPYCVRFVGGKVESFGRFAQLYDMYNRPVAGNPGYGQIAPGMTYTSSIVTPGIGSELIKLKALRDQGVLSEAEFQQAKARLLNGQN